MGPQRSQDPRGREEAARPRAGSGLGESSPALSERQATVLRALVAAYIGSTAPVGSKTLAQLIPVSLSPASVRNTLSELTALGLIEKPHASAGRVPTEQGIRLFVHRLLDPHGLGGYERRELAGSLQAADPRGLIHAASQLLSEHTRQLGFVMPPRIDRLRLLHVSLLRLSHERVLAVWVSQSGVTHSLVLEEPRGLAQAELDRIASVLNEIGVGCTLAEVRERVAREASALRSHAERLLTQALARVRHADEAEAGEGDEVVIATRLALLEQPEFRDPTRVRQLFEAVETRAALVGVLDRMLSAPGVQIAFGGELDEPELDRLALVAAPYGERGQPLGLLGVIGPIRMDYARVIPLVEYVSELVTERLRA